MNSRDRRGVERAWPHSVYLHNYDSLIEDCFAWLNTNYGSCRWRGKHNPRWCWRTDWEPGLNFTQLCAGVSVHFRRERDYAWFMLRWNQ